MPTVFVVDEDPALARLLTNNLRSQGYMVEALNAGQPVLNELARSTRTILNRFGPGRRNLKLHAAAAFRVWRPTPHQAILNN